MDYPLDFNILQTYRQQSDNIADQLIADLYASLSTKEIGQIFKHCINDLDDIQYEEMPEVMRNYFLANQDLPTWVNWYKVERAEQLFLEIGPEYSACLLCRALPIGYTSKNVVKVLAKTGYLSSDLKTGTAKRLLETTQFLLNVMRHNALKQDASGSKHVLKVRFIHAMIRHHLQKRGWDNAQYGIPINQEDMAGTIQTFSVSAIMGLERIHVDLSLADKDALVHFWAVVGHLIGVVEELNPRNYVGAKQLYEAILAHQAADCEEGLMMTRALSNFIGGFLEINALPELPDFLIRFLIGHEDYSNMIGLSKPNKLSDKVLFNSAIGYLKTVNTYRGNVVVNQLRKPANRLLAVKLLRYFEVEFDMKLHIPPEIMKAWGLAKVLTTRQNKTPNRKKLSHA